MMDSKTVMVETIPYSILVLHIVCRFVKWLWDLDPTFFLPISLNGEIYGGSVLKFPQNVL